MISNDLIYTPLESPDGIAVLVKASYSVYLSPVQSYVPNELVATGNPPDIVFEFGNKAE